MDRLPDLAVQAFFGSLLLVATAIGAWRWSSRWDAPLDTRGRVTIALLALTFFGGGLGGFGWILDDPRSFSWDLPPLASRMLAGAGWGFAAVSLLALRRPSRAQVSIVLLALLVYLLPIGVAALCAHRDRFDWEAPITYAFFAVVATMTIATGALLAFPSRVLAVRVQVADERAPEGFMRGLLTVTSLLLLPASVALFVRADGPSALLWFWPKDLLTSRLIAVMLATLGFCALASRRSITKARTTLLLQLVYGLGVVAAGTWNAIAGKPLPLGYMGVLGVLAVLSGFALSAAGRRRERPSTSLPQEGQR